MLGRKREGKAARVLGEMKGQQRDSHCALADQARPARLSIAEDTCRPFTGV